MLYKTTSVADFITGENYLKILGSTNKLVFDKMSDVFSKHPITTDEIRASCDDIKLLGPRDLKQLVRWRDKLRQFLEDVGSGDEGGGVVSDGVEGVDKTDEQIKKLESEEAAEVKRWDSCKSCGNFSYIHMLYKVKLRICRVFVLWWGRFIQIAIYKNLIRDSVFMYGP